MQVGRAELIAIAGVLLSGYGVLAAVIRRLWSANQALSARLVDAQDRHARAEVELVERHTSARAAEQAAMLPVLETVRDLIREHNTLARYWRAKARAEGDQEV